tara:strand:+ start:2708 stop:4294 length:1587 start_codon:yes stop_codon:yes gene_type:complete
MSTLDDNLYFSRDTKVFIQRSAQTAAVLADFANNVTTVKFTDALGVKVSVGDTLKTAAGTTIGGTITAITRGAGSGSNETHCTVATTGVAGSAADVITIEKPVYEIPVLDGFSFTQATNASEVALSEMSDATGTSRRGRRMFTDSYAPAEWSFSTYVRPYKAAGSVAGNPHTANHVHCVEEILWALFAGDANKEDDGDGFAAAPTAAGTNSYMLSDATNLDVNFSQSNKTELGTADIFFALGGANASSVTKAVVTSNAANQAVIVVPNNTGIANGDIVTIDGSKVGVVASGAGTNNITLTDNIGSVIDGTTTAVNVTFSRQLVYKIAKAVVNEAAIEFDIDGIAQINWSGMGTVISETDPVSPTINEGITATDSFIRNRLTSLSAVSAVSGTSITYDLTLTGGSVTFTNNLTFITPEQLGQVNQPFAHVTGGRSIGGSFTCYLNTGDDASAELFNDLVAANTTITNSFALTFKVGGASTPRLEITCPTSHLELPSHSIEDVIAVETTFHALPSTISGTDESTLVYYAP